MARGAVPPVQGLTLWYARRAMKRVRVEVLPHPYDVFVGGGALHSRRMNAVVPRGTAVFLISSEPVMRLHGDALRATLVSAGLEVRGERALPDGERAKTTREWERTTAAMAEAGLDRGSVVVAFGGGTVGDAAGFAAATYMRGLRWIQIPTTLLAMVDSSVGGKTGVNLKAGKNLVGAFHQPRLVLADTRFLATLSAREFQSGAFEVLKCGLLSGGRLVGLTTRTRGLRKASAAELESAIAAAVSVKARIVERDERESGDRALLNLGHTLAHALEAATGYRTFTHGEAVGYGMEFAVDLSEETGLASPKAAAAMRRAVHSLGARTPLDPSLASRAAAASLSDKKRDGSKTREILLARPGKPVLHGLYADSLARLIRAWVAARRTPARAPKRG